MIRPITLSHLSQAFRALVISRGCHSALYGCWLHNCLPEVSPGSLARVQVLGRHSGCRAWGALRARGSPLSNSILSEFDSSLMVQGLRAWSGGVRTGGAGWLGDEACKGFRRTVALRAWGWRGQGCRARGGGARPHPLEHDAQPDESDQRELVEEKRRDHGKTPSYTSGNEGIGPGLSGY
jgi:hypothetical protein